MSSMVLPQWKFLLAGGLTGQQIVKVSDADGDYIWATVSGGGSPGGSPNEIQFNNAGVFGGSANLTFVSSGYGGAPTLAIGSSGVLTATTVVCDQFIPTGSTFDIAGVINVSFSGGATTVIGDYVWNNNGTGININDPGSTLDVQSLGVLNLGDPNGYSTGAKLVVDVPNSIVTSNVDIECTDAADGLILKDRTTATRYRLFIDSGVLDIETV